jgi:CDP-6-deoxy-D-xylo-4-hexulose-3-dehydrase
MDSYKKIWYAPNRFESYGYQEINAVNKCLEEGLLVDGKYTMQFEQEMATYFKKKYSLFVNSGSSANMLALCSLQLPKGSEVITPALTFSTTVSPILQCGLTPIFCDSGFNTYVVKIEDIISLISKKTKVIMLPNLIGNKPDWKRLREYVDSLDQKIYLIEDSCDMLTDTFFSDIATTSTYASHIINSAGCGGLVFFNDSKLYKIARSHRDWGRIGDNSENFGDRFNYKIHGIAYDYKFLYQYIGYNFKNTEVNAAFGLTQLKRIDEIKAKRRRNFERYLRNLRDNKYIILPDDSLKSDWLAIPLILDGINRAELIEYLENNNVQTRVCFSGNITKHPAFYEYCQDFENADRVMENGILLGAHQGMSESDVDRVCSLLNNFIS